VQATAGQIGDVRDAAKRHQVVRADAMHGDAAHHYQIAALIGKAIAERGRRVEVVTPKQAALPEFADALRGSPDVRGIRRNPAGGQQIADRALESGRVEGMLAWNADLVCGCGRWVGVAAVGHGLLPFGMAGRGMIHA